MAHRQADVEHEAGRLLTATSNRSPLRTAPAGYVVADPLPEAWVSMLCASEETPGCVDELSVLLTADLTRLQMRLNLATSTIISDCPEDDAPRLVRRSWCAPAPSATSQPPPSCAEPSK
jgi:hypothetical protein